MYIHIQLIGNHQLWTEVKLIFYYRMIMVNMSHSSFIIIIIITLSDGRTVHIILFRKYNSYIGTYVRKSYVRWTETELRNAHFENKRENEPIILRKILRNALQQSDQFPALYLRGISLIISQSHHLKIISKFLIELI